MTEPRSQKQEREQLGRALRSQGKSWVEIAEVCRQRYRVNARIAFRYAHGWSQRQAAEAWNTRWPDELKTLKNFSYWELSPSSTGHAPSLATFDKLAQLYECSVADLLSDLGSYGHRDKAPSTKAVVLRHSDGPAAIPAMPGDTSTIASLAGLLLPDDMVLHLIMQHLGSLAPGGQDGLATPRERDHALDQLVGLLTSWAHTMKRREVLRIIAWAATSAASAPLVQGTDVEGQERVISALDHPRRIDCQTIEHIEEVLWRCQRQDDALGPQAVLDTVLAQRNLLRVLVHDCPASLRPRLLAALANASRHAGWLSFDLNAFDSAWYYYEDARSLAHEAENTELGAFVLCNMSHLATWQGKARIGIDHAVAAGEWARRTDDGMLHAYAADVAARAYAADGQGDAASVALDAAETALAAAGDGPAGYVYFYDEGLHTMTRCSCYLKLHDTQRAADYSRRSLQTLDPSYTRNVALTTANLGVAYTQSSEIDEATRLLGDAGEMAARNSSARLTQTLRQARAGLQPWQRTAPVRTLDDRLASYGLA